MTAQAVVGAGNTDRDALGLGGQVFKAQAQLADLEIAGEFDADAVGGDVAAAVLLRLRRPGSRREAANPGYALDRVVV
jgi:hypothetical protein